ncbi:MAG: S9 family peptidase [Armatimonadetes bacterium]|nr:S9 family peptidase [Armatimonadota bacterium]
MSARPITVSDLDRFIFVQQPRISPNGEHVVFAAKKLGPKNKYITHLYLTDLATGEQRQITSSGSSNSNPIWSRDGERIFFVSKREPEESSQIYQLSLLGGEASKVSNFPEGSIGGVKLSPDGQKLAVVFRKLGEDRTQAAAKARAESGESEPPKVINSISFRMDGDGYFCDDRYTVWIVDLASGSTNELYTQCPFGHYAFSWEPGSESLVLTHSKFEKIYSREPANDVAVRVRLTGEFHELTSLPIGSKDEVEVSPNGEWIAYIGYADDSDDRGDLNRRVFLMQKDGSGVRCLTENVDVCFSTGVNSDTKSDDGRGLMWSPDSKAIYLQHAEHGAVNLSFVNVETGEYHLLTEGEQVLLNGNISADGSKFACVVGSSTRLMEVAVLDLDDANHQPKVISHFNDELLGEIEVFQPSTIWLKTEEGTPLQAWYIQSSKPNCPTVIEVHGGPHMMYGYTFMHEFQLLAAAGYHVVYSNPRGSKGYGEAHTKAIRGSWGVEDWQDIQTVLEWTMQQSWCDASRIGIMGGSYGGYMTNWAVGHTKEFKSAITDRCVSNLVSKAGNSDYIWRPNGYWPGEAFGDLDSIKVLWNQSPIAYFNQVVTPTLVIHSEGDLRCNIEQSEQVFAALQHMGVKTRFIRYPASTSHGMSRNGPADMKRHRLQQILDWWEETLR